MKEILCAAMHEPEMLCVYVCVCVMRCLTQQTSVSLEEKALCGAVQVDGAGVAPYVGAPAAAQPPAVAPAANGPTIAAFVVPNDGQCGGSGLYCRTLVPWQCKDAQWNACSCNPG